MAAPFVSGTLPSGPGVQAYNPIVAAPSVPAIDSPPFLTPRGAGYDGVAALLIQWPDGGFLCTGSLLTSRDILTAAHCLAGDDGTPQALSIEAIFFPAPTGTLSYTTTQYVVHPDYTGDVIDDNDIALIRLNEIADPSLDRYGLYAGPGTTEPVEFIGFGQRGDGSSGATLPAGLRRRGFNQFEVIIGSIILTDFDNGLPQNDAFCVALGVCQPGTFGLGLGPFESTIAGGDSGGPALLNGQIIGVASFGLTAGIPGGDIDNELNSTFGELSGHVFVGHHRDFIQPNLIPEPGTWLLVASSVVVLGALRRRLR
jgi:secreted trypsin-like serine protease